MAVDCGCLPSPDNIESTSLEKLEKKLKALIKKRDEDIHVLQYQVAELIAANKRQKLDLTSGPPPQATAPPLVAPPQTPVPMQPAPPMTPPHAFPAQALAKARNSLNLCHRCGKEPDQWPDKKSRVTCLIIGQRRFSRTTSTHGAEVFRVALRW